MPTRKQDLLLAIAAVRIVVHRVWQRLIGHWFAPAPIEWRFHKALCLGLDGAGKSALLRRAQDETADVSGLAPTTGFNVRSLVVPPNCKLEAWDIGGGSALRPYWWRYVRFDVDALIWVADVADSARWSDSGVELAELLERAAPLRTLPLLVLLNQTDRAENAQTAATAAAEALRLSALSHSGPRHVQGVSALDGDGLGEALRWLSDALAPSGDRT